MIEWISLKTQIPETFQDVYIKTDCENCPILHAIWSGSKFVVPVIIQCDRHYEPDERFHFIKFVKGAEDDGFCDRITHWIPRDLIQEKS